MKKMFTIVDAAIGRGMEAADREMHSARVRLRAVVRRTQAPGCAAKNLACVRAPACRARRRSSYMRRDRRPASGRDLGFGERANRGWLGIRFGRRGPLHDRRFRGA